MRPVNKGSWPIDPRTNTPKVFQSDRKQEDKTYQKAKSDLIGRLGPYCSYCETWLRDRDLHTEHMLPKSLHPTLRGDWDNFLLACNLCDGPKSNKDIDLDDYYWPDRDNTASIFEYRSGGRVAVNPHLNDSQKQKAQRTLKLTGLDRYPGGRERPSTRDQRWRDRKEAWESANDSRQDLQDNDTPTMRDRIVRRTHKKGFFSVWMTVFRDDSDMLKRFIDAFPGTRKEYFDDRGRPLPIVNFENQPSTDSSVSEAAVESFTQESSKNSGETEDKITPIEPADRQPDSTSQESEKPSSEQPETSPTKPEPQPPKSDRTPQPPRTSPIPKPPPQSSEREYYRKEKLLFNPSLRETPIHEPADVIPSKQQESLLDWLKRTGRLIARDTLEPIEGYRQEEEEISELIVDDTSDDYDDDDEEMEE